MRKLFYKLPYFIKFILLNIYSFYLNKKRYTSGFYDALDYYKNVDYNEKYRVLTNLFNKQLNDDTYYDKCFNDNRIVKKVDIKSDYSKIINHKYVKTYLHTSGTTGSGLKFPISQEFIDHQWAIFWKFRNIHNINMNTWCLYIIGQTMFDTDCKKPPFWIKSYPSKQFLFSQYHLNENTIELYLNKMIESGMRWLHAYPSVLHNFATLIKKKSLLNKVRNLKLNIITTSSEKLFAFQRMNIEKVLGCKVRELYGLTEGVVNIFECEHGLLHIDESYSYVELVQINNTNEYKIIGTSYHNNAFPLIRYDTGDRCVLYDDIIQCNCGRKSRIVKEILGRDEDFLYLNDSTKIGRLDHIFKELIEIQEAQIYQVERGSAIFKIVKGDSFSKKTEHKLINEIRTKLGESFNYSIEYYKEIPKTRSGKLKFVVSEVIE